MLGQLGLADLLLTMGGNLLTTPNNDYVTNDQSGNAARYNTPRRSVYLPIIRNALFDMFQAFDVGDPSIVNAKRPSTTVAPQALWVMNSPFAQEQSRDDESGTMNKLKMLGRFMPLERKDPNVKAILFNIFGGITRGDEVARGILAAMAEVKPRVPMVVRLVGTNAAEGRALLANANMITALTLADAAQKAVAAAKGAL